MKKICNRCQEEKEITEFYQEKVHRKYYRPECISCTKIHAKEWRLKNLDRVKKRDKEYWSKFGDKRTKLALLGAARRRAKKYNLDFNLTINDIIIPEFCPLLGVKLEKGIGKISQSAPSMDRINSEKGYTKDNIWIISFKANTAKNNLNSRELKMLANNFENKISENNDYSI